MMIHTKLCFLLFTALFWGSTYAQLQSTVEEKNLNSLRENWVTDGYWYFYPTEKNKNRLPVIPIANEDLTDVMLRLSRDSAVWVNKSRPATAAELKYVPPLDRSLQMAKFPASSACNRIVVSIENTGTAQFWHPINANVVVRKFTGQPPVDTNLVMDTTSQVEIQRFVIFRSIAPPWVGSGIQTEDHGDSSKVLTIPVRSSVYGVIALTDCTFLALAEDGVIRFSAEGQTKAALPKNSRLVYENEIRRLNDAFLTTNSNFRNGGDSLQSRLWFFYRNIFNGVSK